MKNLMCFTILALSLSCGSKPGRVSFNKSAASGAEDQTGKSDDPEDLGEGSDQTDNTGGKNNPDSNLQLSSFEVFSNPVTLGLKKSSSCQGPAVSGIAALSSYVYFEVLEDTQKLAIDLTSLCGDKLDKNSISIIDSNRAPIPTQDFMAQGPLASHSLENLELKKGTYALVVELGGSTLTDMTSLVLGKIKFSAPEKIRLLRTGEY